MKIKYPEIGICGLSCRLCPNYHMDAKSRCLGCKSEGRIAVGCPFITCAIKKKQIEFCWDCEENKTCEKWKKHRETGKYFDSFKCYQKLEDNIDFIQKNGVAEFERLQKIREQLLREMLKEFNEGRSKRYYCIANTILEIDELKEALTEAKNDSNGLEIKEKSKLFHFILNRIAQQKKYYLKLRK
ncbi:MAG: DUF3795 domain-containing protein [Candidatus Caldatribacteriota bacterium]|nr:DUF3795 domain-containing protein [Candidatus Caldatribacteriota bacterium]